MKIAFDLKNGINQFIYDVYPLNSVNKPMHRGWPIPAFPNIVMHIRLAFLESLSLANGTCELFLNGSLVLKGFFSLHLLKYLQKKYML